MNSLSIDINCDMGESYGNFRIGNDEEIFPYISSCNIACGFHGGDPVTIENTIINALEHKIQIGAHPSYPDLVGFGRIKMKIPHPNLKSYIKYQIGALKSLVESQGGQLKYVKPHGALYNSATDDEEEAGAIAEAISEISPELIMMGMAGTAMKEAATWAGIRFVAEGFADRRYTDQGRLVSRQIPNAVIHDPEEAAGQVLMMAKNSEVTTLNNKTIIIEAQTICIHGDNSSAIQILKAIHRTLRKENILVKSFVA